MQVGQILQTLAIAPFEPPSAHIAHFYSQFDQVCILFSFVGSIIFPSDYHLHSCF